MRHGPFFAVLLAVLSAIPVVGCSRKAERLVGSARLIRGPGGLGATVRFLRNPDRDTYVEPGTADFGDVLIVGRDTTFEARTFLAVASWKLPDTTLAGFSPGMVSLELKRDTTLLDAGVVSLFLAASPWDTATVAWPGPAHPTLLGSAQDDRPAAGSFSLALTPGSFDLVKQWAQDPASAPGFALERTGDGLLAYVPGAAVFRVRYTHLVSGNAVLDSVLTYKSYLARSGGSGHEKMWDYYATLLFSAASRAVDFNHNWLRLGNQGQELGALILLRLEERLQMLCVQSGSAKCVSSSYWSTQVPQLFCFSGKCGGANRSGSGSGSGSSSTSAAFPSRPGAPVRRAASSRAGCSKRCTCRRTSRPRSSA